jgi:ABC-type multidrug transport system ATPase subunit
VSRLHAEVRRSSQGDMLFDHSSNGTFINGQRVRGQQLLRAGDVVQIGPFRLTYDHAAFTQIAATSSYRIDALHLTRQVMIGSRLPRFNGASGAASARLILNDVSLSIYPREFVALVGGSGAGKSTLMKALSGVTPAEGHVLVNGDDLYLNFAAYRSILGYVPQDDIVHQHLSVAGALAYAARLRLPDAMPAEIDKRIADVLAQVEMTQHAAKSIYQLSGGQRKRVSIAVELLADPGLFFLDEPTSGLDPGLEKKMMHTLRRLADAGRTIILVTHATANIDQCDHVAFMADGNLAFYGPPKEALAFFNAQDFADIYTRLNHPIDPVLNPAPPQWQPPAPAGGAAGAAPAPPAAQVWAQCYRSSGCYRQYVDQRLQTRPGPAATPAPAAGNTTGQKDSPWRQWSVLTQRYLDLIRRDSLSLAILLAVMPLIGLLLLIMANRYDLTGLPAHEIVAEVQQQIDDAWLLEDDPGNDNDQFDGTYQVAGAAQTLLFMLALAANLLGVFGAAYEIVREDAIYQRERMVNLSLAPYLLSKIAVLGAFAALQCLLLLWVVQRKVEYPSDGVLLPAFGELYVTLLLASLAGITLGLLLSAVVRNQSTVIYLMLLVLFVQILFAGAIFKLPGAAAPISYLTPTRWALEALGSTADMNRLNDLSVTCVEPENEYQRSLIDEATPPCDEGQQKLSPTLEFNVNYGHESGHLLTRWGVLLLLSAVFGGLTFYVQKRKDIM